ncbi:MAG: hypothetical protein JW395_1034 [Nitrospira sp.]|nr:hypothetical protein [Nitrospira sp.]
MAEPQFCARWECTKRATFEKPLTMGLPKIALVNASCGY